MSTPTTPQQTTQQIERVKEALVGGCDDTLRAIAEEIDWRLRRRTPVDTGRARGNWRVGLGEPDPTVNEFAFDKSGDRTHARAVRILRALHAGMKVCFTNGVKYIMPLEKGHSKKAPNGMIAVTYAELPFIVQVKGKGLAQLLHFHQEKGGKIVQG